MTKDQLTAIWAFVDRGTAFTRIGASAQTSVERMVPALVNRLAGTGTEQNVLLRQELSPLLRAGGDRASNVAIWIVKEWGGIVRRDPQTIRDWISALDDFGSTAIARLIESEGTSNISSWSKILSFADAGSHAVYDARTATALNCALSAAVADFRFVMPSSRNGPIASAAERLVEDRRAFRSYAGYRSYIELLSQIANVGLEPSLLDAEMKLFANADNIAGKYLEGELDRL